MIALLPMKGHSERVPNKNFKDFKGKPLFYWILETLINSNKIEKIIINTDVVEKLEKISITDNKKVVLKNRKEHIRGDFVSMNRVLEDDILEFGESDYIMTHTTNPLISAETLDLFLTKFLNQTEYDSLFSVNKLQTRLYDHNLNAINHDPKNMIRTQDLDPIYEENSCLYAFTFKSFLTTNSRIGKAPGIFITPAIESIDIDNYEEWKRAEYNFEIINRNEI